MIYIMFTYYSYYWLKTDLFTANVFQCYTDGRDNIKEWHINMFIITTLAALVFLFKYLIKGVVPSMIRLMIASNCHPGALHLAIWLVPWGSWLRTTTIPQLINQFSRPGHITRDQFLVSQFFQERMGTWGLTSVQFLFPSGIACRSTQPDTVLPRPLLSLSLPSPWEEGVQAGLPSSTQWKLTVVASAAHQYRSFFYL